LSFAIIGAPNVGKSSLINFLAQSEVAIVSEIPGTTRDVVEIHLAIAGMPVKISDTAGIRETTDAIEKEGIRRALQKAACADIKIFLVDATNPILREDLIDENTIIVVNKVDLISHLLPLTPTLSHKGRWSIANISLTTKSGTSTLLKKLEEKVLELAPQQNSPLITQERYRVALENSVANLQNFSLQKNIELAAEDLRLTARELGKITGKVDIENILDVIFSRFCIGK